LAVPGLCCGHCHWHTRHPTIKAVRSNFELGGRCARRCPGRPRVVPMRSSDTNGAADVKGRRGDPRCYLGAARLGID
jgi:hypothetical protein